MSRKKALLVNPYIEDFSAYDHFSKPLGLIVLASYLKENFDIYFLNILKRNHPELKRLKFKEDGTGDFYKTIIEPPPILKDIPRKYKRYGLPYELLIKEINGFNFEFDYIFITSGMTYWYSGVEYTVKILKQRFKHSKYILGGIYPSLLYNHAKENIDVDYIIPYQEIEKCLNEIEYITGYKFNKDYKDPSYEIIDEYYYLPIMTSRGCVFNCSYCASKLLSSFKQYDPLKVAMMIERLIKILNVRNFAFYDDALLFNSENHINIILNYLISNNIINESVKFYTPNGLHIRFLTEETVRLLRQANFVDIRLSLESSDSGFQINKGNKATNTEFENKIEILKQNGFTKKELSAYILMNVPEQDYNDVEKTMKYVNELGVRPRLAFYSPIPGTPDYQKAMKICDVSNPLFQNNTVYLYKSGFDMDYYQHLKRLEKDFSC